MKMLPLILACFLATSCGQRAAVKDDKEALQGVWVGESLEFQGQKASPEEASGVRITIQPDALVIQGLGAGREEKCSYRLDATLSPKQIDCTSPDAPAPSLGIYNLNGDRLTLCVRQAESELGRPKEFSTKTDDRSFLIVAKKQ